jgi:(S)-ureidoglycine aminohydrolase
MKISALTFLTLLWLVTSTTSGQSPLLPSGVYSFNDLRAGKLTGTTRFFSEFLVEVAEWKAGKKLKAVNKNDTEELIIVKEGQLRIGLNGADKTVAPGSVALILPGESFELANVGELPAVYYRLTFKSNSAVNLTRGKENGGSFVIPWERVSMRENERGGRRDFFDRPTATCTNYEMHVTTLNEGLPSHVPHTHPAEEVILLIKGEAVMSIDHKDYSGQAGDLFYLSSESLHGIRNTGVGPCEYFAFQWR